MCTTYPDGSQCCITCQCGVNGTPSSAPTSPARRLAGRGGIAAPCACPPLHVPRRDRRRHPGAAQGGAEGRGEADRPERRGPRGDHRRAQPRSRHPGDEPEVQAVGEGRRRATTPKLVTIQFSSRKWRTIAPRSAPGRGGCRSAAAARRPRTRSGRRSPAPSPAPAAP